MLAASAGATGQDWKRPAHKALAPRSRWTRIEAVGFADRAGEALEGLRGQKQFDMIGEKQAGFDRDHMGDSFLGQEVAIAGQIAIVAKEGGAGASAMDHEVGAARNYDAGLPRHAKSGPALL